MSNFKREEIVWDKSDKDFYHCCDFCHTDTWQQINELYGEPMMDLVTYDDGHTETYCVWCGPDWDVGFEKVEEDTENRKRNK